MMSAKTGGAILAEPITRWVVGLDVFHYSPPLTGTMAVTASSPFSTLSHGMIEFAAYAGRLGDRSPHDGWLLPSLVGASLIASLCSSGFYLLTWVPSCQIK
jgi:hypothetical protein